MGGGVGEIVEFQHGLGLQARSGHGREIALMAQARAVRVEKRPAMNSRRRWPAARKACVSARLAPALSTVTDARARALRLVIDEHIGDALRIEPIERGVVVRIGNGEHEARHPLGHQRADQFPFALGIIVGGRQQQGVGTVARFGLHARHRARENRIGEARNDDAERARAQRLQGTPDLAGPEAEFRHRRATRASTSVLVRAVPFSTRLTVAMEQPACSATVRMVTVWGTRGP